MAAKQLANAIQHKFTVAPLAGDTTLTWDSVSGWPTTGDFIIRLDDVAGTKTEFVKCTAVNVGLNQTTVVRGQEGTAGTAFSINDLGTNDLTAQMLIDAMVRLDTALSQSLTGPLVVPPTLGGSAAATSYGSMPVKIAENLLAAPAASVAFSSLPSTFRHAKVDTYARSDAAVTSTDISMRFNTIATGVYDYDTLQWNAAAAAAAESLAATSLRIGQIPGASGTANYFGASEAKIKHYAGATGNKPYFSQAGMKVADTTTNQVGNAYAGGWRTAGTAINRIDLIPGAGNFLTGSLFTVWMEP